MINNIIRKKISKKKLKKNWGAGKFDFFIKEKKKIDYKEVNILKKFINPQGRKVDRWHTKLSCKNQRKIKKAIERARQEKLLPYTIEEQNKW